jgi:hypothetical protein
MAWREISGVSPSAYKNIKQEQQVAEQRLHVSPAGDDSAVPALARNGQAPVETTQPADFTLKK